MLAHHPPSTQHSINCDNCDTVMAHWTIRGSNLREYTGSQPTGRHSSWSGASIFSFADDGLITSVKVYREPTEEERAFHMGWGEG